MNEYNFPSILTSLRQSKGLTQEEVSDSLGISNKTLSKWETDSSSPDLSMLIKIAEYYDVSADTLLGIAHDRTTTPSAAIEKEFKSLGKGDVMLRSFELCRELLVRGYGKLVQRDDKGIDVIPDRLYDDGAVRSVIESESMYQRFINSDDVNMFVMLMKNKENFSWMLDEEKSGRITSLFSFLSDPDAVKIVYHIHKDTFPTSFTAEYLANTAGIPIDKAISLLDDAAMNKLVEKEVAHLWGGEVDVYSSYGDGNILALYSLACDLLCGVNINHYYYGGPTKMIGGTK